MNGNKAPGGRAAFLTQPRVALALFLVATVVLLYYLFSPDTSSSVPPGSSGPPPPSTDAASGDVWWTPAYEMMLFNPLEPSVYRPHHAVFKHFAQYHGPFKRDYVTDWLGIETNVTWDCRDDPASTMHYSIIQPSRRLPCEIHAAQRKAGVARIAGELPLVDDEYEEMVDVLESVVRTPRDYVVVELGARYGTWGVRALKAWQQLRGAAAPATFVGVESDATFFAWMEQHVAHNNLTQQSVLLKQFAMKGAETDLAAIVRKSGIDHINYLDTDIQHSEGDFFDHEPTLTWMDAHVDVVHIGTHSDAIHTRLKTLFDARGWVPFFGYALGYHGGGLTCDNHLHDSLQTRQECMVQTPFGKVYVRDGMLSYGNPRLFAPQRRRDSDADVADDAA